MMSAQNTCNIIHQIINCKSEQKNFSLIIKELESGGQKNDTMYCIVLYLVYIFATKGNILNNVLDPNI